MPKKFNVFSTIALLCFLTLQVFTEQALAKTAAHESSVTIPLKDYLNLIKEEKKELQFSSVESVHLNGEYGKPLSIVFAGSSSTNPLEVSVMGYNNDFSLSSCRGDAALSLKENEVVLFPQAKRFKLECQFKVNDWQNLKLNFKKVLAVMTKIKGAEAVYQPGRVGEKNFAIFPKDRQPANDDVAPSFVSRYTLSLLKDENQFTYVFQVENPNKKAQDFVFTPRESEVVKNVHSNLRYSEKDGGYHFVLPPGNTRIQVDGRFNGKNWTAPIASGLSYLLVEQHPMITAQVQTKAKRVSKTTVGIHSRYPVTRAYILSEKDQIAWEKSELEAFTATTYTIDRANYNYFWSRSGHDIVEATYQVNNQGANEIPLEVPGTPTYVEVNNQPQILSKNKDSQLVLNIPTGQGQQVLVQYKVEKSEPRFLASIHSQLPKPEATVSASSVTLQLPKDHQPLFSTNGEDWKLYLNYGRIINALVLFILLSFFFVKVNIQQKWRIPLSLGIALLSLYFQPLFGWLSFAVLMLFIVAYRDRFQFKGQVTWKKALSVAAIPGLVLMAWVVTRSLQNSGQYYASRSAEVASAPQAPSLGTMETQGGFQANRAKKMMALKKGSSMRSAYASKLSEAELLDSLESGDAFEEDSFSVQEDNYQGLPARIQIPSEGRKIYLQHGFAAKQTPLSFATWSFNGWFLKALNIVILLFCGFLLWRERLKFVQFIKGPMKTV